MSTVVLVLAEVYVPVLMYLEPSAFTHVVCPLSFVDSADLMAFDQMLILKCLLEVEPDPNALLNLERAVKLADVDTCLVIPLLQRDAVIASLLGLLVVDRLIRALHLISFFASQAPQIRCFKPAEV